LAQLKRWPGSGRREASFLARTLSMDFSENHHQKKAASRGALLRGLLASRRSGCVVNVGSIVGTAPRRGLGSTAHPRQQCTPPPTRCSWSWHRSGLGPVEVVPGEVRSGLGHANTAQLAGAKQGQLQWGMYHDFTAAIEERARVSQGAGATEASVFARHVAARVMRPRSPREIVYGSMMWLFAVLAMSPACARDAFFARRFGLNKL
jgi:hypothetical protein